MNLLREVGRLLAATSILAVVGCGDRPSSRDDLDEGAAPSDPAVHAGAGDDDAEGGHAGPADPYTRFEGLRPVDQPSWPVESVEIERYFGWRIDPSHGGFEHEDALVFVTAPRDYVLAIADGEVVEVVRTPDDHIAITIDHADGLRSRYAPLSDALVHAGMPVDRGVAIGLASGRALELRVLEHATPIDPGTLL